ncbi:DUF2634 domain-containing protein [Clostridium rectalis]|uniref:DUF2634 domain-containing protein n=1 Tax=Clostridium rectalis TaxID=2040295 RepID=UPI000F63DB05|nr:DUF2634 domain-containing protein [Clostridium rectalis]
MGVLPEINVDMKGIYENMQESKLPLFKEFAWDFKENKFIYIDGKIKVLEGKEALKVWIYKALSTPRYRYLAYSFQYGHEFDNLIGKGLSKEALKSEAKRYLKECLLINPYIIDVPELEVTLDGLRVDMIVTVNTVYDEINIEL